MHSTQTNVALGSKPIAGHLRRQEGHLVLNACAWTKVLLETPSKSQGIGGNRGKIECNKNFGSYDVKPFRELLESTRKSSEKLLHFGFKKPIASWRGRIFKNF